MDKEVLETRANSRFFGREQGMRETAKKLAAGRSVPENSTGSKRDRGSKNRRQV
jgi:hypothetical protein